MSSSRTHVAYLDDISQALQDIRDFTLGMSREAFLDDRKTMYAVVRSLEIIGEAAGKIPLEVRRSAPNIPWAAMVGMRNRLAHEYFGVDMEIV